MRASKFIVLAAVAASCFMVSDPNAQAQIGVSIGVAPECPYGYYDVFIGAGPWFHGPDSFRGHVNNAFHPEHGYKGAMPHAGEKAEAAKRVDKAHFTGNEERDGRGHATEAKR
jgi:hypothetical protein